MVDLQFLALKNYPEESNENRDPLVAHGLFEGIHNSQIRLDLRKNFVDAELTIETDLEKHVILKSSQEFRRKKQNSNPQMLNPTIPRD